LLVGQFQGDTHLTGLQVGQNCPLDNPNKNVMGIVVQQELWTCIFRALQQPIR
jgi:hypothetical protein